MKKFMAIFIPLLILAAVISAAVISTNAYAEYEEVTLDSLGFTIGGIDITESVDYEVGSTEGSNANNVLFIKSDKKMTISGSSKGEARILVTSEKGADLTFSNLTIVLNKTGNPSAAFAIDDSVNGAVTITLEGDNKLQSGYGHAGLEKNNSELLIIKGKEDDAEEGEEEGKLEAYGHDGGAGIGGAEGKPGRNITIESGIIYAEGLGGAGIGGGGDGGSGEGITINGGKVTAKSLSSSTYSSSYYYGGGAGIGGGKNGSGIDITITDGTVKATGISGAGIGGGLDGDGVCIEISGGEIYAKTTSRNGRHNGGAGIGGGCGGDAKGIIISGGKIIAKNGINSDKVNQDDNVDFADIEIHTGIFELDDDGNYVFVREDRADVTAVGDGAGIGGGAFCTKDSNNYNREGKGGSCDVTICGSADVKADGGVNGAGIGGGNGGSSERIEINLDSDGKVYARSQSGAAIGGGTDGDGKNIYKRQRNDYSLWR